MNAAAGQSAPRGQTQWVRNLRAVGTGELRVGRRVEPFRATEIADDAKAEILRAYLKKWKFEVGVFFDGVDANAPADKLREIAPGYPIFRIAAAAPVQAAPVQAAPVQAAPGQAAAGQAG